MGPMKSLATGAHFGRLTVVELGHRLGKAPASLFDCSCGTSHKLLRNHNVVSGKTNSCGCIKREMVRQKNFVHGESHRTREYNSWNDMRRRCNNPKDAKYHIYGGRGIKVCQEWDSYSVFLRDMGRVPSGMSIDRRDVNGPYCKDNCKWSTAIEQANNRRRNHIFTWHGNDRSVSQWAKLLDVRRSLLDDLLIRRGFSIPQAAVYLSVELE